MLLVICQLSRDVIGYEGPATVLFRTTFTRTVMLNLCTDSECTNRTDFIYLAHCKNRTLAVPSVRLYRLCNCNRLSAQKQPEVFIQPLNPTYQRAALERQCITEISVISFSLFQNLQVRCFVFSFSVCIFLALFLSCLYEYF